MHNEEIILVVGGSSDIGGEIIRSLAGEGGKIIAHYHTSTEKIIKLQEEFKDKIVVYKADLKVIKETNDLVSFIQNGYECPKKIVFLAAPPMRNIRFKNITWDDFQRDLDIQLRSAVLILKTFLPLMAKKDGGKVVFLLSSVTIQVPPKTLAHYTTVKYALMGLMKSLASEYADKKININGVSPSMVETDFLKEIPEKIVELAAESHPLKRNALPKDIAPLVKFLLSSEADYLTGVNIPICGGLSF